MLTRKLGWGPKFVFSALGAIVVIGGNLDYLNADTIMHSIMSNQNVTPFYWGQNRLFSLLPFLFSVVSEPGLNLFLILFFANFSFFLLLFMLCDFAAEIIGKARSVAIGLLSIALFLLIISDDALVTMTIHNFEHAVSGLLMMVGQLISATSKRHFGLETIGFTFIFLSIFLNPAFLIFSFLLSALRWLKLKELTTFLPSLAALISFLIWLVVSLSSPGLTREYVSISPSFEKLTESLESFMAGFSSIGIMTLAFGSIALSVLVVRQLRFQIGKKERIRALKHQQANLLILNTLTLLFFSVGWVIFFGSLSWLELNNYAFRYFSPIFFALHIALSMFLHVIFENRKILVGALGSTYLLFILYPTDGWTSNPREAAIYLEIDSLYATPEHPVIHAGSYWQAWPAVHRDMIDGVASVGASHRGLSNKQGVLKTVDRLESEGVDLLVVCWVDSEEECNNQVQSFGINEHDYNLVRVNAEVT